MVKSIFTKSLVIAMSMLVLIQVYDDTCYDDTCHFSISQSITFEDLLAQLLMLGENVPDDYPKKKNSDSGKENAEWKEVKLRPSCYPLNDIDISFNKAISYYLISDIAMVSDKIPTPPPDA